MMFVLCVLVVTLYLNVGGEPDANFGSEYLVPLESEPGIVTVHSVLYVHPIQIAYILMIYITS